MDDGWNPNYGGPVRYQSGVDANNNPTYSYALPSQIEYAANMFSRNDAYSDGFKALRWAENIARFGQGNIRAGWNRYSNKTYYFKIDETQFGFIPIGLTASIDDRPGEDWIHLYESTKKYALAYGFAGQAFVENGLGGDYLIFARTLVYNSGVYGSDKDAKTLNELLNLTSGIIKQFVLFGVAGPTEATTVGLFLWGKEIQLEINLSFYEAMIKRTNPDYYNNYILGIHTGGTFNGGGTSGQWH